MPCPRLNLFSKTLSPVESGRFNETPPPALPRPGALPSGARSAVGQQLVAQGHARIYQRYAYQCPWSR